MMPKDQGKNGSLRRVLGFRIQTRLGTVTVFLWLLEDRVSNLSPEQL